MLIFTLSVSMQTTSKATTGIETFVDESLNEVLETATGPIEVIVTFEGDGAPTDEQISLLEHLNIQTGVTFENLPIAGVLATKEQVEQLVLHQEVRSLFYNAKIEYENAYSTALTGVDKVRTDDDLRKANGGFPVTGDGIGVVVNDSGVDGTHDDHKFGENLVQNVLAATNLNALSDLLPITYQEDVPNTDSDSGHGTHVAGTVGGTGAKSGGKYEGVAPGANLIGYGSGAGVAILDTIGGFDYALTHQNRYDIRVITNSWGATGDAGTEFNPDDPINVATKKMYDRGIVTVFSAGNSGPGESSITGNYKKAPWVITVAAGTKDGTLSDFSSRGVKDKSGTVEVDGEEWVWEDRPTITAPGVDIISTRTISPLSALSAEDDLENIETAYVPYYTTMSGTSMAAPHVAGVVALMLEADPTLSPLEVKNIIENTATNMPGYEEWEAGAGYINAYAAVDHVLHGTEYGDTVNMNQEFHANAEVEVTREDITIDYNPLSLSGNSIEFKVEEGLTELLARIDARGLLGETGNPVNLILTDPDGNEHRSGISALFTLFTDRTVQVLSPTPGTWTMEVEGLEGLALPEEIEGELTFKKSGSYTGLDDIAGHEAEDAIKLAVNHRLVDSDNDRRFRPDHHLTRVDLARYLTMGSGIRQGKELVASDVKEHDVPFVQAVTSQGAALRDTSQVQNGVMLLNQNGKFASNQSVTREELAYSLVQSLGLQEKAEAHSGDLTVSYKGERVAVLDAEDVSERFAGYVQLALDLNILHAHYEVEQGQFDLEPEVVATFEPKETITRGEFAVAITRFYGTYLD
ncbi:S8 family serine peptidase [Bacillus shivajii]|uniref:S8 family serine peptidase n=1 Tax=Bacillus shivajii TaxID=1983719 RepID=UPI001CF9E198|nr:S8 family serine peptidase [Bacillus shivajii]UCZ52425.1 S8 family serine peptidase [Bacillus shivajii]